MRLMNADKVMKLIPTEEYNARIAIAYAPTVDAVEVKHGHWTDDCRCSECGAEAITEWNETGGAWVMTPFCPFCGAEMEMDEDEE